MTGRQNIKEISVMMFAPVQVVTQCRTKLALTYATRHSFYPGGVKSNYFLYHMQMMCAEYHDVRWNLSMWLPTFTVSIKIKSLFVDCDLEAELLLYYLWLLEYDSLTNELVIYIKLLFFKKY